MGFIELGSGHVVHGSQLPDLNPDGSIEVLVFNEAFGVWQTLIAKSVDLDGDIVDSVNEHFWSLVDDQSKT